MNNEMGETERVEELNNILPQGYFARYIYVEDMYGSTSIYRRRKFWWSKEVAYVKGATIEFTDKRDMENLRDTLEQAGYEVTRA